MHQHTVAAMVILLLAPLATTHEPPNANSPPRTPRTARHVPNQRLFVLGGACSRGLGVEQQRAALSSKRGLVGILCGFIGIVGGLRRGLRRAVLA